MKKVAVLQSNYIPWKGYFDIINDVDLFLFYDEVQYTKNDWRNRNKILTPRGPQWLTLPCGYNIQRKIYEVTFNPSINWQKNHYQALCENYCRAPFFRQYKDFLEYVYMDHKWEYLYELNRFLITNIARNYLDIGTIMEGSEGYYSEGRKSQKLLSLLKTAGTDTYVTGPAARNYLDEEAFRREGIRVIWKDYSTYPEYRQMQAPFTHYVSILDLLFNTGPDAPHYIWGYRDDQKRSKRIPGFYNTQRPMQNSIFPWMQNALNQKTAAGYRGGEGLHTIIPLRPENIPQPPRYPRFSRPVIRPDKNE